MNFQFKKSNMPKKILVALLAICLLAFVVTSSVLSLGVHHDCTGENCIVCFFITMGKRITACNIFVLLVATILLSYTFFAHFCAGAVVRHLSTPVCLKVKLSD